MSRAIDQSNWLRQAVSYHQTGAISEAERLYRKVLKSQPNHPAAALNIALLHAEQGRTRSAKSLLGNLLRVRPDNGDAHHLIAKLFEREGEVRKASYHFARAANLVPGRLEVHLDLIRIYGELRRIEDARLAAEHALRQFPENAEVRHQLGVALASSGGGRSRRSQVPV